MWGATAMVSNEQIRLQLDSIKAVTNSDILAFALLNQGTRKLSWHYLLGAQCARTFKIKQSATSGLTGQALRTGKPQNISIESDKERFCFGEAILMTEELSHVYVWPVAYQNFSYQAVVIIGNKENRPFNSDQLDQATLHIKEIDETFNSYSLLV